MRYTTLFLLIVASTARADDVTLNWTVPGKVKPDVPIAFPIAQSPVVVNDRHIVTIFPPNYLLGSDDRFGKRVWLFPWNNDPYDDTQEYSRYSSRRPPRRWGNRTTSFATNDKLDFLACVDSEFGTMFAFDPQLEGRIKWRAFGAKSDDESLATMRSLGPPCIVGDSVFCLTTTTKEFLLVDLDLTTGQLRSQIKLSAASPTHRTVRFSPILAGKRLVCPCPTNELVAVVNTGRDIEWRAVHKKPLASIFRIDVVGRFILTLCDGVATCLDLENGKQLWSRDGLGLFPFVRSGNTLILGSDATAVAIDIPTGTERWNRSLASETVVAANGTMHDGNLLLPMTDNTIIELDIQTGSQTTSMDSPRKLGHLFSIGDYLYSLTQSDLDKLSLVPNSSPKKAEP